MDDNDDDNVTSHWCERLPSDVICLPHKVISNKITALVLYVLFSGCDKYLAYHSQINIHVCTVMYQFNNF